MIKISINGFSVDIRKINYINIIEVSDENDKMYITINLGKCGVIRTTTTNPNDIDGWDRLTDVGSIKGTKVELIDVLKEESFL